MTEIAKSMLNRMRELTEEPEAKNLRETYDAWRRSEVSIVELLQAQVLALNKIVVLQDERITRLEKKNEV